MKASFISSEHISDACSLYLLSFLLDSSIGLVIIYFLLYGITAISIKYNIWYIMPGRYAMAGPWGVPPKEMLGPWCVQCLIYLFFSGKVNLLCTNLIVEKSICSTAWSNRENGLLAYLIFAIFPKSSNQLVLLAAQPKNWAIFINVGDTPSY